MSERQRQIEARTRESRAWELTRRGYTQERVAATLGVTQQAVSKILRRAEGRFLDEFRERVAAEKARQTAVLEWVVEEALDAWQQSKRPATITEVSILPPAGRRKKGGERTRKTEKGQSGNPAHLAEARAALREIRAIWGLDAPARTEAPANDDTPERKPVFGYVIVPPGTKLDELSDEERKDVIRNARPADYGRQSVNSNGSLAD
jgi:predicted transcriptional regulator